MLTRRPLKDVGCNLSQGRGDGVASCWCTPSRLGLLEFVDLEMLELLTPSSYRLHVDAEPDSQGVARPKAKSQEVSAKRLPRRSSSMSGVRLISYPVLHIFARVVD